jgi:hypothetical protein
MTFFYHPRAHGSRDRSFSCSVVKPRWTEVDIATVCLALSLLPATWRSPEYEERTFQGGKSGQFVCHSVRRELD